MMLLALHGPAIEASRRKLWELRKKFDSDNVVVFEEGTDLQVIKGSLETSPLFSDQQLIILENPPEDLANYILPLQKGRVNHISLGEAASSAYTIILWFDHIVDTKKWPGFEYLFFPESKEVTVFHFLDYLAAQDTRVFLEIEKFKKTTAPVGRQGLDIHYFITMVFYLLRNLVATPKTAPDFVKQKLAKQRSNFSKERLINLYRDILEIDFKLKSGLLEKNQAEFLLVNKFIIA